MISSPSAVISVFLLFVIFAEIIYMMYSLIKAFIDYRKSGTVKNSLAENTKTLGKVLQHHRMKCRMTLEFVAETLNVSQQAIINWENGASNPSNTNLMALAVLFGVTDKDLLNEANYY